MNALLAIVGIVVVLLVGFVIVWNLIDIKKALYHRARGEDNTSALVQEEDGLKELVEQMREKQSRENDAELAAYAKGKRKHLPINDPFPSFQDDGKIHQRNPKAEKILIPENLSEVDRAILKDFFNL